MQLILTHFFNYPFFLFWASVSYPVQKVDASHRSDLGRVIDEADVSLGGGVQLSDLNVAESIQELAPHVASDSVPDGDSNFVVLLIFFLQKKNQTKNPQWNCRRTENNVEGKPHLDFSPLACCRGNAASRRCTASPSRCTSCSRPRTERLKTSSSEQEWDLEITANHMTHLPKVGMHFMWRIGAPLWNGRQTRGSVCKVPQ